MYLHFFGDDPVVATTGAEVAAEEAATTQGDAAPTETIPVYTKKRGQKGVVTYQETAGQTAEVQAPVTTEESTPRSWEDIVKDPVYAESRQAWVDGLMAKRFKNAKATEESNAAMREVMEQVAVRYGLDPAAEDLTAQLKKAVGDDSSVYENYAVDHGITTEEAKHILDLEAKVRRTDAQNRELQQREQDRAAYQRLQQMAEETKKVFPNFDLDTEMQNKDFMRLVIGAGVDTTAAMYALHHKEIVPNAVKMAEKAAVDHTVASIASGTARPVESAAGNIPTATFATDPSKMTKKDIRDIMRRVSRGEKITF